MMMVWGTHKSYIGTLSHIYYQGSWGWWFMHERCSSQEDMDGTCCLIGKWEMMGPWMDGWMWDCKWGETEHMADSA